MTFNLITAVYNDEYKLNLWIDKIKNAKMDYVVYKKSDNLKMGECNKITDNLVEIPNIGRCDYAFLYHIIENYDNLATTNVFVKCNWFENNIRFWDLLVRCQNYDYMQVGTHYELLNWNDFSKVDDLCETKMDWLKEIFPHNYENLGFIPGWGHGPSFSVSRELIHRHKKEVYEHMLNKFHESSNSFSRDYLKYGYESYNKLYIDVGIRYHNDLCRFYRILFTHDLPENNIYKICRHEESAQFNKSVKKIKMGFL